MSVNFSLVQSLLLYCVICITCLLWFTLLLANLKLFTALGLAIALQECTIVRAAFCIAILVFLMQSHFHITHLCASSYDWGRRMSSRVVLTDLLRAGGCLRGDYVSDHHRCYLLRER